MNRVELVALTGLPEVGPGDDLAELIANASRDGVRLTDGDILAVSSKVVAKTENRYAPGESTDQRTAAVAAETVRVVASRTTPRGTAQIVESRSGPVLAAAGVDASNVPPGPDGAARVLLLPADPDAAARQLRARLTALTGRRLGVLLTDTLGRPWRTGQADTAIGAAGVCPAEDLSGHPDTQGRAMEVTLRALADEIAAAADLVKGKTDGVPVAVVRGLAHLVTEDDGPGAASLLRPAGEDWFRYGHAEAARAALGLTPELVTAAGLPPQPVSAGTLTERLQRAVTIARAAPAPGCPGALVTIEPDAVRLNLPPGAPGPALFALGALAQRILVAAWAEDVLLTLEADGDGIALTPSGRP